MPVEAKTQLSSYSSLELRDEEKTTHGFVKLDAFFCLGVGDRGRGLDRCGRRDRRGRGRDFLLNRLDRLNVGLDLLRGGIGLRGSSVDNLRNGSRSVLLSLSDRYSFGRGDIDGLGGRRGDGIRAEVSRFGRFGFGRSFNGSGFGSKRRGRRLRLLFSRGLGY